MFLLQANSQADPTIGIAYIIGLLIPLVIVSVLSAWFIKLGYKLLTKKSVSFTKPFWISFFSIATTFIVQAIIKNASSTPNTQSSIVAVLPAMVFFLTCWVLNSQFIKYSDDEESKNYGLAFGVTVIQFACLMVIGLVFVFGLMNLMRR